MRIYSEIPKLKNPTSVAMGLFDGIHRGHKAVLKSACETKYEPVAFTIKTQSGLPKKKASMKKLISDDIKHELMEDIGIKTIVEPQFKDICDMSPESFVVEILVKNLNAKKVFCGNDFRFGKGAKGDVAFLKKILKAYDVEVVAAKDIKSGGEIVSSSRIRKALSEGNAEQVNRLLGYNYYWKYPVILGQQNGRVFGFPTINQKFPLDKIVPKYGVYATIVETQGKIYAGVTDIGVKPTVHKISKPLAETHIIDFEGNLYGKMVKVSILEFLRPEKKFKSIKELKTAIAKDKLVATELFAKFLSQNKEAK